MNLSNLFNWFRKKYTYRTECFQCEFKMVQEYTANCLRSNGNSIPVNVSVCPAGISGVAYVAILFKTEVK